MVVVVYYFTKYDVDTDKQVTSQRPGTLEAIASAGGEPILDTRQEVESARLDGNGFLSTLAP